MRRKAKIVATLGPASQDETVIRRLIEAGMDVARLNFSHGTHESHAELIRILRSLSNETGKPVTILQDLQGPKIRIGDLPKAGVHLSAGQTVFLTTHDDVTSGQPGDVLSVPMDFPLLPQSVHPGNRILLDDGHLELQVVATTPGAVETRVVLGGLLSAHKGVNLPGAHLDIPGFTEKDREDLEFGLAQGVDAVAISFVRTAHDVDEVRETIRKLAPQAIATPIIAKLERPEALEHLEEIIHTTDGVMVARGDLGVEIAPSYVPIAQKRIIDSANRHGKIVITATQMLDSMIHNPRPTRAEASDVANAVFDGTDAVMLSGETASGEYPVESVEMMASIVQDAEDNFERWGHCRVMEEETSGDDAVSLTRAARELAHDRNVAAIAVFTQTGRTALLMAKARPRVPILALTPDEYTYRRLGLLWGCMPFLVPFANSMETMIEHVEEAIVSSTSIENGQQVVLISGFPVGASRPPNFALLHTVQAYQAGH